MFGLFFIQEVFESLKKDMIKYWGEWNDELQMMENRGWSYLIICISVILIFLNDYNYNYFKITK